MVAGVVLMLLFDDGLDWLGLGVCRFELRRPGYVTEPEFARGSLVRRSGEVMDCRELSRDS